MIMERKQFLLNMVKLMPVMALAPSAVMASTKESTIQCQQIFLGKEVPAVIQKQADTQQVLQAASIAFRNGMFWITDLWGKQYCSSNLIVAAGNMEFNAQLNAVSFRAAGIVTQLQLETTKSAAQPQLRCFSSEKLCEAIVDRWIAAPKPTLVALA